MCWGMSGKSLKCNAMENASDNRIWNPVFETSF